ncbi:hypothetical protein OROHE_024738 [Orobanche hederae]
MCSLLFQSCPSVLPAFIHFSLHGQGADYGSHYMVRCPNLLRGNHSRSHPSILPEQKHPSRITKITEPPRLIYCNPISHPVTKLPEQDFRKILKIGPINDMDA